ncbi:MAG: glycosyltransferase family 4 protein [Chloroflexi bacterium]|nr:glycosyltransferase family 4 protein [Chloroflexota bacterium]
MHNIKKIEYIYQLVTGATSGNAIYNEALIMQQAFKQWGYKTTILAERIHPSLQKVVKSYQDHPITEKDLLLFHYSLGSQLSDYVKSSRSPLILRYHNITPLKYLTGTNPWIQQGAEKGIKELPEFAKRSSCTLADSSFNQQDLIRAGFTNSAVLPLIQPEDLYTAQADTAVLNRYTDNHVNLLFVGRIAPNKRQEDIIKVLHYYRQLQPKSRLLLVGSDNTGQYGRWLRQFTQTLNLSQHVHFVGHVTVNELAAYYQVAHAFICMSEHEGFCNPLIESMRFKLPIVAYASTAVPSTLGNAGIQITKKQPKLIASLLHHLQTDNALRMQIIGTQQKRAQDFAQKPLLAQLRQHIETTISQL